MKAKILVVGSSNVDFVQKVPCVPASGESILSSYKYSFVPGGKGANSAVALARLGGDVLFCARLGADNYGVELKKVYSDEKIDTRFIKLDKSSQTGMASIMVESNGANRIIVFPGANELLCAEDVEEAFIAYPDALLTQFEINPIVTLSAVRRANEANIPIFIDAGPIRKDFVLTELCGLTVFSPNESEAYAYTGIRPRTMDDCLYASMKLYNAMQTKYIVLKLGDRGAYIYDGKYCEMIESFPVTAVDTTAAGDAFTAALTYKYMENGNNITDAVRYANAVGALTVMGEGAITSLPTKNEVEEFIEKAKNK